MSPPRPNEAATYQWWPLDLKNAASKRRPNLAFRCRRSPAACGARTLPGPTRDKR